MTNSEQLVNSPGVNPTTGGARNASKGAGSVVRGKTGKKRRARSMGRYPFAAMVNRYLKMTGPAYAEATVIELKRRYARMEKDLLKLQELGKISTPNPEKMTNSDILAYIGLLKARGLKESGIVHNISSLNSLLLFAGNPSVEEARKKYPSIFPKRRMERLPPMREDERELMISAANNIDQKDWRKMVAFGLVVLGICSGLRPKELRLSKISDLDTDRWVISTIHVKGEGTYGRPREAPIDHDGRPFLLRYLRARKSVISKDAPLNDALFPALQDIGKGGDGHYSMNGTTNLRKVVAEEVGFSFDLRKCRRTFGQKCVDDGISVEAVSVMMGHNSTKTTESYYARKRSESAILEAEQIWQNRGSGDMLQRNVDVRSKFPRSNNISQSEPCNMVEDAQKIEKSKSSLIENKKYITGYA